MGREIQDLEISKNTHQENDSSSKDLLEQRLISFANLIVDRLIEIEQESGLHQFIKASTYGKSK